MHLLTIPISGTFFEHIPLYSKQPCRAEMALSGHTYFSVHWSGLYEKRFVGWNHIYTDVIWGG